MIAATGAVALLLLLLSVPLFIVFGASSSLLATVGLGLPWTALLQVSFDAMTKHVLIAIPLFVIAGNMMLAGGTSRRLVDLAVAFVGHLPGGLALAMVLSMAFFGAFCGSILAGITAIGSILLPPMFKAGYPKPFVIVLAACAAILEALIPPSNTAIIYSAITHVPVSKTFAAGVLPGLVLMTMLCIFVVVRCWRLPRSGRIGLRGRATAAWAALPALFTPVIILGGIYSGLFTAAESAAVAAVWGMFLGAFIYRELTWSSFFQALKNSAVTTTIIFAIIGMAILLSVILTFTRAPQGLVSYLSGMGVTPMIFMMMVVVILLVLGTFLEVIPVFYLTLPILIPAAISLGIDLLHFYIVFTAFVALGMLTPPVCVGVYVAAAVANEPPASTFRAVPPFLALGVVYGFIMIMFPWLATWIPSLV